MCNIMMQYFYRLSILQSFCNIVGYIPCAMQYIPETYLSLCVLIHFAHSLHPSHLWQPRVCSLYVCIFFCLFVLLYLSVLLFRFYIQVKTQYLSLSIYYFIKHNTFQVHPRCHKCQHFIPFRFKLKYSWLTVLCQP